VGTGDVGNTVLETGVESTVIASFSDHIENHVALHEIASHESIVPIKPISNKPLVINASLQGRPRHYTIK